MGKDNPSTRGRGKSGGHHQETKSRVKKTKKPPPPLEPKIYRVFLDDTFRNRRRRGTPVFNFPGSSGECDAQKIKIIIAEGHNPAAQGRVKRRYEGMFPDMPLSVPVDETPDDAGVYTGQEIRAFEKLGERVRYVDVTRVTADDQTANCERVETQMDLYAAETDDVVKGKMAKVIRVMVQKTQPGYFFQSLSTDIAAAGANPRDLSCEAIFLSKTGTH